MTLDYEKAQGNVNNAKTSHSYAFGFSLFKSDALLVKSNQLQMGWITFMILPEEDHIIWKRGSPLENKNLY